MERQLVEVNTAQQFYIATTATPADDRPRVLKYGDLFAYLTVGATSKHSV
jgi:hypothetical protein